MSDAKAIVEAVLYEQLAANLSGAAVYQDAPNDSPLPVVIIGDMTSTPIGMPGDPDRRVAAMIVSMVGAEERAPLLALQEQIETFLDGNTFASAGWRLSVIFEDDDAQLAEDGVTYIGTSAFTVLALSD